MSKLIDIGKLSGPLIIFGGVYSNVHALRALKTVALQQKIPPSHIICTGDVVGYCADPEASVREISEWGVHTIAGNVELNLRDEADDCGCNFNEGSRCDLFSRMWYPYAQQQLSETSLGWINGLPDHLSFMYGGKVVHVLHGSANNVSEFIFRSSPWEQKLHSFDVTGADIILAGHSGIPFEEENDGKTWLNSGVIGMPANDATPRVWYLLLDDRSGTVAWQFQSLDYDFQAASAAMRSQPLPPSYAETLVSGLWDNCEILPDVETKEQGIPLAFSISPPLFQQ